MTHDLHTIFTATEIDGVRLERRTLGRLAHRGPIVACDPLTGTARPFAAQLPAGSHPVEIVLGHRDNDERVALARVVFADVVPQTFELATRSGEDIRMLAPGQRFGYGVDAGTGCFATPEVSCDGSAELLAALDASQRLTWGWAATHPRGDGHQRIAFSTGFGDGVYSSYLGRDGDGAPVCLVTDFQLFPLILPALPDDPAFRRRSASAAYARVKAAIPQLGTATHDDAYVAAGEFVGSPGDTAHLARAIVADLLGASDPVVRELLLFVVSRLLVVPAVQRELAPHLATLPTSLFDGISVASDALDPAFFTAVAALWVRGDPGMRRWLLDLGGSATVPDEPLLLGRAGEALGDPVLADAALLVFDYRVVHGHQLPAATLARIREVGRGSRELRVQSAAFRLLARTGDPLADELAAPDPQTRLAAARVLNGDPTRADAIVAPIAADASLPVELRRAAMQALRDPGQQLAAAAALALALAGDATELALRQAPGS